MSKRLRVLLLADTHLGIDLPAKPRIERRRRGDDFFANFDRALEPARRGDVDLVVHGGDVLYRSKVRAQLVQRAFAPLLDVADRVPVVVVPGNHERSAIPYRLLTVHSRLFVFDRPRTIRLELAGRTVAISGFPCERHAVRDRFIELVEATGWRAEPADVRLLCLHQAVEGARVGVQSYTFRRGADVIRGRDLPSGFAAVLAGHIHRHQVLTHDLAGRPLAAAVLYPGAIERTSRAEREETKGFLTLELAPSADGGRLSGWRFHPLPARPMVEVDFAPGPRSVRELEDELRRRLANLDPDAVVRLRPVGEMTTAAAEVLRAESLRSLAPPTMNVTLAWPRPGGRALG